MCIRDRLGTEHRTQCRGREEGHVGVPHGIIAYVGDRSVEDQHLRGLRYVGVDRVDVQVAEARGKARLLLGCDRLVPEEQHLVLEQCLLDGVALLDGNLAADVHAADLGAEGRAEGGNGQAHVFSHSRRRVAGVVSPQSVSGFAHARAPACAAGRAGPSPGRRRSGRSAGCPAPPRRSPETAPPTAP